MQSFGKIAMILGIAALATEIQAQPSGSVTTLGGTGVPGYVDGGKGVSQFSTPAGLTVRKDGTIFVADFNNNVVRSVNSANRTATFATANHPIGLVFDSLTNLFVANQGDGSIRKFDYFGNFRANLHPILSGGPITALAIDRQNYLYIAQLNGVVVRFNPQDGTQATMAIPGAREVHGLAVEDDGSIYVSDSGSQVIWKLANFGANPVQFAGTLNAAGSNDGELNIGKLNEPWQIAVGQNNSIVIADRGNHKIRVASCAGVVTTLYGIDSSLWFSYPGVVTSPGWWDSSSQFAELRDPMGIAVDLSSGTVYDTETYYHLVRAAVGAGFPLACGSTGGGSNGGTTGTPDTVATPVLQPSSGFFPNGVTVTISASNSVSGFSRDTHLYYSRDGTIPTTASAEVHIDADGVGRLTLEGPVDLAGLRVIAVENGITSPPVSATPTEVPIPILSPSSGYYPMGVDITVTSTNGFPDGTLLYYTTDASEPTTNSSPVFRQQDTGAIAWNVPQRDLRSLRVKAFLGPNAGKTVSGTAINFGNDSQTQGEIGVPIARSEFTAGIGSYYILPIVANLRNEQELRSIQFVVEVVALPGSPRLERGDVQVLTMSTNDFIQVLPASVLPPDSTFSSARDGTNRVAVAYFGTNSGFNVAGGFATVAMVGIQFRFQDSQGTIADLGDGYTIQITDVSGTSDGIQRPLPLKAMPQRTIRLNNTRFLEGDTAPAYWYNAGDFGDGLLQSDDANNAILAAFGFRRPFSRSDVFAAMDVYRIGVLENVIEYNDAATILLRGLGFESADIFRMRDLNGEWESTVGSAPTLKAQSLRGSALAENSAWSRDVVISGQSFDHATPLSAISVPVYMKPNAGLTVSGMQLVADVVGENGAPPVTSVTFVPSGGIPLPKPYGTALPNTVYARWDGLDPGLTGSVLLGWVQFTVPATASTGQDYAVIFRNTGGAFINWDTGALHGYLFESIRAKVWIGVSNPTTGDAISDEWREHFFGSSTAPAGDPESDADGDGFTNYEEYLAGTDPTLPTWQVRNANDQFTFRWVGHAGKNYTVEQTEDLKGWNAITGRIAGQDGFLEYNQSSAAAKARFYRLKVD